MKISQQITSIETIQTAGELGALFLESTLVKKHQPLFNRKLRHARKLIALRKTETEEGYFTIEKTDIHDVTIDSLSSIVGIFKSQKQVTDFLYQICDDYGLCPKLFQLEKGKGECFSYHLEKCKGACIGKMNPLQYNLKFDEAFYRYKIRQWPFNGPIVIKERGESEEHFIVDKWCVIGNRKHEEQSLQETAQEYEFDYDTYKILQQYLRRESNLGHVHSLS
jgi:DNA polymerase-3 subunit epsilon